MSLPPCVLWIDPGGMTGLASYAHTGTVSSFECDEYEFLDACNRVAEFCRYYGRHLWIGWERFKIGPKTPPADAASAIEVIGVARFWGLSYGCRILTGANSEQRKAATRPMLQLLDWWVPGKDDAQSAAAHLLAWMMREKELPPRERGILMAARQGDDQDDGVGVDRP